MQVWVVRVTELSQDLCLLLLRIRRRPRRMHRLGRGFEARGRLFERLRVALLQPEGCTAEAQLRRCE